MADDLMLPVLRQRWSPREFDTAHELADNEVQVLLEAARWAPSAGNSQPWSFHAVRRGERGWGQVADHLAESSRQWASQAGLLVVNLCHRHVEDTDWDYSEFSVYDLGQAVAHMTIQAHSMGLACRQFRAFDKDGLTRALAVPPHWEVLTMTAIGRPSPEARRELRTSSRHASVEWPLSR